MDRFIDARLDRVEKALATVIDSISKYNPSPALAEDLLAADRELSGGLEELQRHQQNHARILGLRADVAALDAQIKSTLLTLAASRRDMLATPATVFPGDDPTTSRGKKTRTYDFTYDQLMSYARRISRNTAPAPGQTDGTEFFSTFGGFGVGAGGGGGAATNADTTGATTAANTPATTTPGLFNGVGTEAADTPGGAAGLGETATTKVAGTPAGITAATATTAAATPVPFTSIVPPTNVPDVLPADFQQYVAPAAGTIFFPWPMPELMMHGGLRTLQSLTDQISKAGEPQPRIRFVSLQEQEEQERQQASWEAEEREAREQREAREEEQRRMAHEAAVAAAAGSSRGGGGDGSDGGAAGQPRRPAPAAAPAQFASTLDMEDDD
ncbi:mediator of RNA polymerase 2 transcription subunit 4 [Grosmannia clavigera kw1407]|uniref:Mediator of RNA polymerase II transcription subunit 4 n=1 Tax=Grosmannia clavigera (strain kw1407 / UAMH 11150) TaxID=655863 RepID=F0X890_GROCL|nr:mediator of RNA polymerase 2 transcription subunit 4 [Grosmannia clavigera kw1407]EFX06073.1 mediator of RNA polymerase 2 transcription subunit 4 [Grosmannia clavigera kw1407]